jgi:hypothetical protein
LGWLGLGFAADYFKWVVQTRKLFVDGPILVLPASEKINYIYDPNTVLALDDNLTLYQYEGEIHVTDEWGMLKTSVGVVLARENGRVVRAQVPAPTDASKTPMAGNGWTLELKPGWELAPGSRPRDFVVRKKSNP